jgi:hypothetical protein
LFGELNLSAIYVHFVMLFKFEPLSCYFIFFVSLLTSTVVVVVTADDKILNLQVNTILAACITELFSTRKKKLTLLC